MNIYIYIYIHIHIYFSIYAVFNPKTLNLNCNSGTPSRSSDRGGFGLEGFTASETAQFLKTQIVYCVAPKYLYEN